MQKNDLLVLDCQGLGADMEGVCRADGMAVFVPGMLPGEKGRVRIVKAQKRFAFGRLETLEVISKERARPPCPAFPRCGGCTCQHMTYEATLSAKRRQVKDCFERIGGLAVEPPPVLGMDDPWRYRNKTSLPVGGSLSAPFTGFYAPRSHDIVPIQDCPVAKEPAGLAAAALREWMAAFHVPAYSESVHQGLVRHLMVRVSRAGEAMAVIAVNGRALPHEEELIHGMRAVPGLVSLILNINPARTNVILGKECRTLWGRDTLEDTLCGLSFELSPLAFFQVNPGQTEKLYETAVAFAGLTGRETVADVYCGAGTISLLLAKRAKKVLGIELAAPAVENARQNARRNGVSNAEFFSGAAEELLPRLVGEGLRPDVIVLDPPRKGAEPEVLEAIAAAGPQRVVYVSCNPATLARDAGLLARSGYVVSACQPVDMFCWTSGVETVVLLSKGNAGTKQPV